MRKLKFSKANTKLKKLYKIPELQEWLVGKRNKIYSLDKPAGWSCPFAKDCLSKAVLKDNKTTIKDGKHTKFRCYAASQEAQYRETYEMRRYNFSLIKGKTEEQITKRLEHSLPANIGINRIDSSGDFHSQAEFNAWVNIAIAHPDVLFYAYTKSLVYWIAWLKEHGSLPHNLVMTASRGGRTDYLIDKHGLREAVVVYSEQQAADLGLEIDNDDSHASRPSLRHQSFALLIHGTQPKGSEAGIALQILKQQ
jgi:hypothetical protein